MNLKLCFKFKPVTNTRIKGILSFSLTASENTRKDFIMKKLFPVFLVCIMLSVFLSGCTSYHAADSSKNPAIASDSEQNSSQKITIIATLFPQYDFARQLAGEKADVKLLLPPGMESHSYEPTPGDIITIQNSDVFLYTGDDMEPWVSGIVENLGKSPLVANLSDHIELEKEIEEGHHEEHSHHHLYNPHIWTSPVLAIQMVKNIEEALVKTDPDNADYYRKNSKSYQKKLHQLDQEFKEIVSHAKHDTVYIGSRFSLLYFMEEYGLSYVAAYDSCEEEAEPSIKRVVSMIKTMRKDKIPVVYYEELTEPYIASTIAEAADAEMLLFHSCHNVSKNDLESGVTYLSLMKQNAINLRKGLGK